MTIEHSVSEISNKFKKYNSEIFEIWEDYLFLDFYMPELHKYIKAGLISHLEFQSLFTEYKAPFTKKNIYGVIDRIKQKQVPERAFLEAIALTENFLQDITYIVYRDFPHKLETKDETQDQQFKILKVIIDSIDKNEVIDRLSEEKIRNIFYGKPVDFFKIDKAKIGINDYIKSTYNLALIKYEEIIARRNVYIHNHGKVDRKYIREVPNTNFKLEQKPKIDKEYLMDSIKLLQGLTSITTILVLKNTYATVKTFEKFKKQMILFDKMYKGK